MNILFKKGRYKIHIGESALNLPLCKDSRIEGYSLDVINSSDIIDPHLRNNYDLCKKCLKIYFKLKS